MLPVPVRIHSGYYDFHTGSSPVLVASNFKLEGICHRRIDAGNAAVPAIDEWNAQCDGATSN